MVTFKEKSIDYIFSKKGKKCKKTIDNSPYRKYNTIVMQKAAKQEFQKGKGECIHYEKADKSSCSSIVVMMKDELEQIKEQVLNVM